MQKLQRGGTVNFHVVAAPFGSSSTPAAPVESEDTELVDKSLLKDLYEKGLPSDVDHLVDKITALEHRQAMGLSVSASALSGIKKEINRVIQNANYMSDAEKRAEKNDSFADVAVDARGYLYCAGEKGVEKKHFKDYDATKDQALTVGDLVSLRKENFAFENDYIQTIGSSIGMSQIQKYITDIVKTVGESTTASDAYTNLASIMGRASSRPSEKEFEQISNMASIAQTMGADAIFKQTTEVQQQNFQEGLKYIYSVLPQNMKNQLAGQFVAMGGKADKSGDYIVDLISTALESGSRNSYKEKLDYDKSANDGAGTSSEKQWTLTGLEQLIQGTLGQRQFNIIGKNNSGLAFTLNGNGLGKLMDAKNDLVNESILSDALNKGLGALIDQNNIYFGDQKISPHSLDKFVYDGADVIHVWAPVDSTGAVDLGKLAAYEELRQKVKKNPNLKPDDIREMMAELGLNGTLDANGNFVGQDPNMEQFIVLTGLTSDEVIDADDNELAYTLQGQDKKESLEKIKRIYGIANKGLKGDSKREFPTGWWDWSTDVVAAPIFMRIGDTARFDAGTVVGHGAKVPQQSYANLVAKDQARPITKPSSSML